MNRSKLICLLIALLAISGCSMRCFALCSDQTRTQQDYDKQRDSCRKDAQLKIDMATQSREGPVDDKSHKAMLVSLFSECMGNNGWNVPGAIQPETKSAHVSPEEAAAAAAATAQARENHSALLRSSECNFARANASASSLSASRAKACDLECAQHLKAAPEAPRPAACPADTSSILEKGREME